MSTPCQRVKKKKRKKRAHESCCPDLARSLDSLREEQAAVQDRVVTAKVARFLVVSVVPAKAYMYTYTHIDKIQKDVVRSSLRRLSLLCSTS